MRSPAIGGPKVVPAERERAITNLPPDVWVEGLVCLMGRNDLGPDGGLPRRANSLRSSGRPSPCRPRVGPLSFAAAAIVAAACRPMASIWSARTFKPLVEIRKFPDHGLVFVERKTSEYGKNLSNPGHRQK